MPGNQKKEDLLSTWKEIANYLDQDTRTSQRWEDKLGLPVHRLGGGKFTVFAYKSELDKWLKKRSGALLSPQKRLFLKLQNQKILLLMIPIILVIGVYSLFVALSSTPQPSDFRIQNSHLMILNEKGKLIWDHDTGVENLENESTYKKHFQYKQIDFIEGRAIRNLPHLKISDLDSDNLKEILFSIQTKDEFKEGKLICFNHKGDVLWEFDAGREIQFGEEKFTSDYRIHGFDACDLNNNGHLEIVILARHKYFFPSQLIVLNNRGERLGEYWNVGYLIDFTCIDLNKDGTIEIVCTGTNNEYEKGCLAVFDSREIRGGSPQLKKKYKCDELELGSELYYILFPRTDVDLLTGYREVIMAIDDLNNDRTSVLTGLSRIYYEFTYNFELYKIHPSDHFRRLHNAAVQENSIHSELNDEYIENLRSGLLYYDGKNWVSKPTMTSYWKNKSN